jgi:hypothetical protein
MVPLTIKNTVAQSCIRWAGSSSFGTGAHGAAVSIVAPGILGVVALKFVVNGADVRDEIRAVIVFAKCLLALRQVVVI